MERNIADEPGPGWSPRVAQPSTRNPLGGGCRFETRRTCASFKLRAGGSTMREGGVCHGLRPSAVPSLTGGGQETKSVSLHNLLNFVGTSRPLPPWPSIYLISMPLGTVLRPFDTTGGRTSWSLHPRPAVEYGWASPLIFAVYRKSWHKYANGVDTIVTDNNQLQIKYLF